MTAVPVTVWDANVGGPRSRKRTEAINITVLGNEQSPIHCPRVLHVGLDFGLDNPLDVARALVAACGFDDEEEARRAMALPTQACICRVNPYTNTPKVTSLSADEALFHALVLGLSTPWQYDPRRPVLWTRTSLSRQLDLFEGQGFYA